MKHLTTKTLALLDLDDAARRRTIDSQKWVPYPRVLELNSRLERLLNLPDSFRFEGLSVYGAANVGKTLSLRRFDKQHPFVSLEDKGEVRKSVVYMSAPRKADEKQFYRELLKAMGADGLFSSTTSLLEDQINKLLSHLQVRMLIIDEFHHFLVGSYNQTQALFNEIKRIGDQLHIAIVTVGLPAGHTGIERDDQLRTRLKEFEISPFERGDDYSRLLISFESLLPLHKPSNLNNKLIATHILDITQGVMGEISTLLKLAAQRAIDNKVECITLKIINELIRDKTYIKPPKILTTAVISANDL